MSIELSLLGQILNLARDPEVELESFGEMVGSSPRLAAEIVRVSNSALYGMEGRIQELQRALLILGIKSVSQIASAILVGDSVKAADLGVIDADQIWMHSLETGIAAQLIARCLGLPLEAEAYLTGLLHDLGMVDLHVEHGSGYAALLERAGRETQALEVLEQEALGTTHAARLAELTRSWDFPELLQKAVAAHHDPEQNGGNADARTLGALVRAAHRVIEEPAGGWQDVASSPEEAAASLADLGLLPEDVQDLREELAERLKDALAVL